MQDKSKYVNILNSNKRSDWIKGFVNILIEIVAEEKKETRKSIDVSGFLQETVWKGYSLLPYQVIRSALFSVNKHYKDKDGKIKEHSLDEKGLAPIIACHGNYEIRYLGPQINQSDLDVLLGCFELSRRQGEKNKVEATLY
ncbi:hypothetical protein DA717_15195, partial [Piscirickettsiaceae bacterium NZ-RLO2]